MVMVQQMSELKVKETSVMICMPTKGEMKTRTSERLLRMFVTTANHGIRTTITYAEGTLVSAVRSVLVKQFLASDYEYLFFLDSDMVFNDDIVLKLLSHNKKIACGVAKVRGDKSYNIYHYVPEKEKYAPVSEIKQDLLIEIDATGCSCVLIHRKVFEDILARKSELRETWKELLKTPRNAFDKVVFENLVRDEAMFSAFGEKSEDIFFFEMARACGYKVFCDLSIKCNHITEVELIA
jgi:hypothetical protein